MQWLIVADFIPLWIVSRPSPAQGQGLISVQKMLRNTPFWQWRDVWRWMTTHNLVLFNLARLVNRVYESILKLGKIGQAATHFPYSIVEGHCFWIPKGVIVLWDNDMILLQVLKWWKQRQHFWGKEYMGLANIIFQGDASLGQNQNWDNFPDWGI